MTRTLVQKTPIFRNIGGFTLIEVLVVIGLIALIMAAAIPTLNVSTKAAIGDSAREFASLVRSTYDESVLTGQIYRVVVDIEHDQYWAEVGKKGFLLRTAEQEEERLKRERQLDDETKKKLKEKEGFSMAARLTKAKKKLPRGIHFTDVQTTRSKEPIKTGLAYAHVFPHGFIEKLVVHVRDDYEREATLIVNPVNGKSQLFGRFVKEAD